MNKDSPMNPKILSLVKSYCGSRSMARFLSDRKKLHITEQRVLGKSARLSRAGVNADLSLDDKTSFDQLLTMCKYQLSDHQYTEVLLGIGNILKTHGELQRAKQAFDEVMMCGRKINHPGLVAEALLARGDVYSREGRW